MLAFGKQNEALPVMYIVHSLPKIQLSTRDCTFVRQGYQWVVPINLRKCSLSVLAVVFSEAN